ncbi:hypothetical protein BN59_01079 [Legionella massiliensis]|uniref:Bacterial EndoU nuclease domain-containing protein n=1 Tax=Legionella massiliensis TaxID=1034943 RepID=A0A078KYH6_9GAMM|nr:EndoU domain-containing protein [Legionella massiliensis]CDZ76803.1 hypothetical protein BN59_01079 [Legionella massiliensis]CEE12541.1 hypothetical protein BN1094_01079 [Legionella massiliensis]
MNKYQVLPNKKGEYFLGPQKNYVLTKKALQHIILGDFTSQKIKNNGSSKEIIRLAGGLHTVNGWLSFKKKLNQIVHGRFYDPNLHNDWYFAKELQNGVILLKLPMSIFKSKAAKITKNLEVYYKSGYLWKTLFPKQFSTSEIVALINEALEKTDNEETSKNIITGYALTGDDTSAIKICISLHGNNIGTAYPTWGQPNNNNFGSPFSSIDSMGFILSLAAEIFDEDLLINKVYTRFPTRPNYQEITKITPSILSERPIINKNLSLRRYLDKRKKAIELVAINISEGKVDDLINYLYDFSVSKDPANLMIYEYAENLSKIQKNFKFKNMLSIYQNIHEIFFLLFKYDNHHKTQYSLQMMEYYLKKKFIHFDGIDGWESKRIFSLFIDIAINHHCSDSVKLFIDYLSVAPSRIAAYISFNSEFAAELRD